MDCESVLLQPVHSVLALIQQSAAIYVSAPDSNCIVVLSCQRNTGHGQQKNPAHREGDTKRANSRTCYILWRINGTHRGAPTTAAMTRSEQNQSGFTTHGDFFCGKKNIISFTSPFRVSRSDNLSVFQQLSPAQTTY